MTRVAIVGAGAAGVAAAFAAAERGAHVILLEAGDRLPPPKSAWPSLLGDDERQLPRPDERAISAAGIEIHLNQRVSKIGEDLAVTIDGRRSVFDAVVLSTGGTSVPERLEGMRKPGVHALDSQAAFSSLREKLRDYGKTTVCGSGPVAIEVAEKLRAKRVAVSLLAPGGFLPMLNDAPRSVLMEGLSSWGVKVSDAKPERVVGVDRVEAVVASGEVIPCDSCVIVPRVVPLVPDVPAPLGRSGGLIVDGKMQSARAALFGAGDCAEIHVGSTTLAVMFESSAKVMGTVAGANAAGANVSARVVGSFFKELVGVGVAVSGLGIAEATGLGLEVIESAKSWRGELACSLVFEKNSKVVAGAQLAGRGVARYAEVLPLIVASGATMDQLAYQETIVSSDISPISETAREGLR